MSHFSIIGTPLYQWESGRKIQIVPLSGMRVDSVHFSNYGDSNALVVEPKEKDGVYIANIPNILLCDDENIVVYSVNVSEDKTETLRECVFAVRKRAKPSDYVYTETEVKRYESLEERIKKLEDSGGSGGIVDQTYNPESANAQSGVALAPIFQKKLEIWQPNTEYKVGDVVVWRLVMGSQSVSNILVCIQNHTSGDDMFDTVTAVDYWDFNPIIALNSSFATCDDNGNYIIDTYATKKELEDKLSEVPTYEYIGNTYATKEELRSAIGEALEGDY